MLVLRKLNFQLRKNTVIFNFRPDLAFHLRVAKNFFNNFFVT